MAHRRVGFDARDALIELTERLVAIVALDVGGGAELVLGAELERRPELVVAVVFDRIDRPAGIGRVDPVVEVRVVEQARRPQLAAASAARHDEPPLVLDERPAEEPVHVVDFADAVDDRQAPVLEIVAQVARLQVVVGVGAEAGAREPVAAFPRNRVHHRAARLIQRRAGRAEVDDVFLNGDRVDEVEPAAAVAVQIGVHQPVGHLTLVVRPGAEDRDADRLLALGPAAVDAVGRRHGAGHERQHRADALGRGQCRQRFLADHLRLRDAARVDERRLAGHRRSSRSARPP